MFLTWRFSRLRIVGGSLDHQYGSLLPPTGWAALGLGFLIISGLVFAKPIHPGAPRYLASVAPGSFALTCFVAARRAGRGPQSIVAFPAETSLLDREGFVPVGFQHGIKILNDHRTGGILMPLSSLEEASRVANAIVSEARAQGRPLICRAVSSKMVSW